MLGAIARAGSVLGEDRYLAAARKNAAFLRARLWDEKTKSLFHRWRDGQRDNVQLVEGYAFMLSGILDLYEATLDEQYLQFAVQLAETRIGTVL
jgi:uncharacterized protein YyaL (SSP411 family)